jgi:hypothetical protein
MNVSVLRLAVATVAMAVALPAFGQSPLVGSWKLVSYARENPSTGNATPVWGEKPSGLLQVLPDGRLSAVITAEGRKPAPPGEEGLAEKQAKLYQTVTAYAGTYTARGNTLTVHVEVASAPEFVGKDLVREILLEGDVVYVRTQPMRSVSDGKDYVYVLAWKRLP